MALKVHSHARRSHGHCEVESLPKTKQATPDHALNLISSVDIHSSLFL